MLAGFKDLRSEDRGQKTEDRRQRTEDRGQKTEDRRQNDLRIMKHSYGPGANPPSFRFD